MKKFLNSTIMTVLVSAATNLMASTLTLPATMDAGSVQAKLKNLLFSKLEADGEITGEYQANLTGSYVQVTLEDAKSKVVCSEFSAGQLAVQQFFCKIEIKDGNDIEIKKMKLENTMDAASVQAVIKNVLFDELDAHGPVEGPYEAKLFGSYSQVTLVDHQASVVCNERSAGMLAVQTFGCSIAAK